ncbi:MAG: MFS transporter [Actinomycetales bacterium]|nr:MFS transporter [Actinomycetales bacterium]
MPLVAEEPVLSNPWQYTAFRNLTVGHATSSLGNAFSPVALAFAVLHLGGSATDLGIVLAAYALAQVVTTLVGGVLGDRLPRSLMMQGSSAVLAVIQAIVAASLIGGWSSIQLLAISQVLTGCVASLSSPSSQAATSQVVPPELLARAVTIRRLLTNTAMVFGFSAAGMVVAAVGPGWAVAVDAATYAVAALFFSLLRLPPAATAAEHPSMLGEAIAGAREVFRHTWLWALIAQALIYHLFYGGAQGVLGPIVVKDDFGEAAWGWALGVLMVGFMIGGLVTLRWRPRRLVYAGTILLALTACFPAALAAEAGLHWVLIGAFLHGFGLEIFSVNWDLAIQQNIPPDKLARVFSFDVAGSFVARPIGFALTGPVAEAFGYHAWLWVVAAVIVGTLLLVLLVPSVRRVERHTDGPYDPTVAAPGG